MQFKKQHCSRVYIGYTCISVQYTEGIYHFIDRKLVSEKFNWHSFTASQIFFFVQLISAFIKMVNSCRVCNDFNYDEWLIYSCYLNVF